MRSLFRRALLVLLAALFVTASPALAHKDHKKPVAAKVVPGTAGPTATGGQAMPMAGADGHMDGMMAGMDMDRSNMTTFERLVGWIGRLHPMIVHFPIAFFPAALFTAVIGRRRDNFARPVQFLVVAGGVLAPIAAGAGWLAGMTAEPEAILDYHRWLGVVIGLGGAGLAVWAWKRPWEDRGAGMILALTVMTIMIAVQGFLGAGLTHGIEHLMF